jgi:hypothetical protein
VLEIGAKLLLSLVLTLEVGRKTAIKRRQVDVVARPDYEIGVINEHERKTPRFGVRRGVAQAEFYRSQAGSAIVKKRVAEALALALLRREGLTAGGC